MDFLQKTMLMMDLSHVRLRAENRGLGERGQELAGRPSIDTPMVSQRADILQSVLAHVLKSGKRKSNKRQAMDFPQSLSELRGRRLELLLSSYFL